VQVNSALLCHTTFGQCKQNSTAVYLLEYALSGHFSRGRRRYKNTLTTSGFWRSLMMPELTEKLLWVITQLHKIVCREITVIKWSHRQIPRDEIRAKAGNAVEVQRTSAYSAHKHKKRKTVWIYVVKRLRSTQASLDSSLQLLNLTRRVNLRQDCNKSAVFGC